MTCRDTVPNAGTRPVTPRLMRVSMIRAGGTGMTEPGPDVGWRRGGAESLSNRLTTVAPLAVLAASQVTNCANSVGLMVSVGSVPTAMWWKVS